MRSKIKSKLSTILINFRHRISDLHIRRQPVIQELFIRIRGWGHSDRNDGGSGALQGRQLLTRNGLRRRSLAWLLRRGIIRGRRHWRRGVVKIHGTIAGNHLRRSCRRRILLMRIGSNDAGRDGRWVDVGRRRCHGWRWRLRESIKRRRGRIIGGMIRCHSRRRLRKENRAGWPSPDCKE